MHRLSTAGRPAVCRSHRAAAPAFGQQRLQRAHSKARSSASMNMAATSKPLCSVIS